MNALMNQLVPVNTNNGDEEGNKENGLRRSRRLQTTSSPIPLPPKDLRKSVLTNNLVRTGQKSKVGDVSAQVVFLFFY